MKTEIKLFLSIVALAYVATCGVIFTERKADAAGAGGRFDATAIHKTGAQTMAGPLTVTTSTAPALALTGVAAGSSVVQIPNGTKICLNGSSCESYLSNSTSGAMLANRVIATAGVDIGLEIKATNLSASGDYAVKFTNSAGTALFSMMADGQSNSYSTFSAPSVYVQGGGWLSGQTTLMTRGTTTDSGTAVSVVIDSANSLSTSGAKLVSIRNNTTEKASFDKDGRLAGPGATFTGPGSTSAIIIEDGDYLQFRDSNAGAPPAADCDTASERGRFSLDTTNNLLYFCNGTTRGWDTIALVD